ncbi:MAG: cellobiose phosphorylase [Anaerolineae bacterium]|nr:cellobiose phosphorylase [Anaerolineae bacterium]
MADMTFDAQNRFIFEDYANRPTFASFLPGIAGPMGIPMWVFYVNRGQAVAGFGVESKDTPITEFEPANKAYRNVSTTGFRTFLKIDGSTHEPFAHTIDPAIERSMHIGMNELELVERSPAHALETRVLYFTLTGEPIAGLVRRVTISNTGSAPVDLAVLDGLPLIYPFGVDNLVTKTFSRTVEAWMGVENLAENVPFYRLSQSLVDKAEVTGYEAGHFYTTFTAESRLPALVDPDVVFGENKSLSQPDRFIAGDLESLYRAGQITTGKTPCGFFGTETTLSPGESITLYGIVGHASNLDIARSEAARLGQPERIEEQYRAAQSLAQSLTDAAAVQTGEPLFDAYTRQTFLDNVLRGGWPILLGDPDQPVVQHIYSRKHGDLERDYNDFYIAPEFYSQGNGNYRDVNQNRREDVWLNPRVGDFNVRSFMNLIQADGYNSLVVYGNRFTLLPERRESILSLVDDPEKLSAFFDQPFTPGSLLKFVSVTGIGLRVDAEEFLSQLLRQADTGFTAVHHEGYWVDHWTYNLDLIENYLSIYPERKAALLFEQPDFTFYDSPVIVLPRDQKYVIRDDGKIRQYDAVREDPEKAALIASRETQPNVVRVDKGQGDIFTTTLFARLVTLALVKFATRDPGGMGIEMEANKPGWYDAANGLPGLFGSSMPETFELARLVEFLRAAIAERPLSETVDLPVEIVDLLRGVLDALRQPLDPMSYWDTVSTLRETYRERVRLGFDGKTVSLPLGEIDRALGDFAGQLRAGIERALALNDGIPPTYLIHHARDYDLLDPASPADERRFVRVKKFEPEVLPLFLEGPVRYLKTLHDQAEARALHQRVRESDLFDAKLKMYKTNASLADQPIEIGRARAFPPGWLENESIWLHMEYKYLLSLLKAGLVDAFYEDFRNVLIPFQDPEVYGRSLLENSSFIVSSAHVDPSLHGRGFVARLSGSTAEFLSILHHIMIGPRPFTVEDDQLCLRLDPALPGWLFDESGTITCTFLGSTTVEYQNESRRDTFGEAGARPVQIVLTPRSGETITLEGGVIPAPYAEQVRDGMFERIQIDLD